LDEGFSESHNADVDVTGGIMLKASCASMIAQQVEDVWLLNGTVPSRILNVVSKEDTVGTRVLH
jgi:isopentenyl phosphate kinase